jgi:hypothetical protein
MTWIKGIKFCPKGEDIDTCPIDKLILHTNYNTMKVAHHDSPSDYGQYSHGLGYAPAFIVANGLFNEGSTSGFVAQYNAASAYEAPFFTNSTIFYYWGACRYFLFYQGTL